MKIIDEDVVDALPKGALHIYTAILHPDIQENIREWSGGAMNVYLNVSNVYEQRIYIVRRDMTYNCIKVITY